MNRKAEKALRSEIYQEEKDEETRLRHTIKDVALATKEQQKARKALRKADNIVAKMGKKETVATAAVQKATHKHDIAATNLRSAQRDAELKRQEDTRLQQELDEKKARLDTALQEQKVHKQERQSRLREMERGAVADSSAAGGVAGPLATHSTGVQGQGVNVGTGTAATHPIASDTVGNTPGQHATGPQVRGDRLGGPGNAGHHITEGAATGTDTRAGGTGYSGHTPEGAAVGASAGHGAQRDIVGQSYGDDHVRDSDRVGQPHTTGDQATYEPSGVAHRSDAVNGTDGVYAGERSIGRHDGYPTNSNFQQANSGPDMNVGQPVLLGESGPFGARDASAQPNQTGQHGNDTVHVQRGTHTSYPREGPGDFGGPGSVTASEPTQYTGEQAIPASATGYPSAPKATGYSGAGGENLGFRGDPMLGSSGTGGDPGIRSGGYRNIGGKGDTHEYIGEHNVGLGSAAESRYGTERIGDQYTHHATGIGSRQGVGDDPNFSRDRISTGSAGRFGPGMKQTGDIDNRARGSMTSHQGFGEDSMPGGYTQAARSGGLDIAKERLQS